MSETAAPKKSKKRDDAAMSDEDILSWLGAEWAAALGEGDDIEEDRARALDYIDGDPRRGYLKTDIPPLDGLSSATSSDVSDAIETILPDLMEIFTAGEDIMMFSPRSPEDEPQAEQETDYVNYVFYSQNEGWMTLYTAFKDALTSKTGVLKWWWETEEEADERAVELPRENLEEAVALVESEGWTRVEDVKTEDDDAADPSPTVKVRFEKTVTRGKASISAVAPEDFRVDPAATSIADASWAAMRTRQRVWQLAEQGLPRDELIELPEASLSGDEQTDSAARRFDQTTEETSSSSFDPMMKLVEVREYHAWLDPDGGGEIKCWRIITGADDTVLLSREEIADIQFETLCPYPLTHRFYGRSLADLLVEVQKIKTMLFRVALNHAAFASNPRPEVSAQGAGQTTISDLLDHLPGRPVISNTGQAVRWLPPPALGFDIFGGIEFFSTVAESRTGVARNAQGLNPDTLHDTAKGALELMGAAQRRVRMIARIFAETGLKRFFLRLHDLIVRHADKADYVRLRNGYVNVDPSTWGRRHDLTIDVGLGSNTKTYELQFWQTLLRLQREAAQSGVAMRPQHFWNAVKRLLKAGNVRNPDLFFPNPAQDQGQQQQNAPPPNPEAIKAQGELQIKQQELELKKQEMQAKLAQDDRQFQFEAALALYKTQLEAGNAQRATELDAALEKMAMEGKFNIESFRAAHKAQTETMSAASAARARLHEARTNVSPVRLGGHVG